MATQQPVGPEYQESGDPTWIEAPLGPGGALGSDIYRAYGRWRERIYPAAVHSPDPNPAVLGRIGLYQSWLRVEDALKHERFHAAEAKHLESYLADPLVQAMTTLYEALEWTHSLDEHLKRLDCYASASEFDPEHGPFVDGALGARNASHHGLRRVFGVVEVAPVLYGVAGLRWVHLGRYDETESVPQIRWARRLPLRSEPSESATTPLRFPKQEVYYNEHLAGREVRNTLRSIVAFFLYVTFGEPVPAGLLHSPAVGPPPINVDLSGTTQPPTKHWPTVI